MASALSAYDSALSVLGSDSTAGGVNLDAAQKSLAQSIIAYNIVSQGLTLDKDKIVWTENGSYYTVYYKDSLGRELSEIYQYSVDDKGVVSVHRAEIHYVENESESSTITNTDYAGDQNPQKPSSPGPEVSYEINHRTDGTTTIVIKIDDQEYTDLPRQINPDGTISYILGERTESDGTVIQSLFVVNQDGSKGYYTEYKKSSALFNGENGNTTVGLSTEVNGETYNVAGGRDEYIFGDRGIGKYVVVQDQNTDWHKLVNDGAQWIHCPCPSPLYPIISNRIPPDNQWFC